MIIALSKAKIPPASGEVFSPKLSKRSDFLTVRFLSLLMLQCNITLKILVCVVAQLIILKLDHFVSLYG